MKLSTKLSKYLLVTIVLIVASFLFVQKTDVSVKKYFQEIFPCNSPLEFSIGKIDSQFEITQEELVNLSQQAAAIWNRAASRTVLIYNPEASFKINLIFDERQEATMEAEELEENLNDLKLSQEALDRKYESIRSAYKQKVFVYEKDLGNYQKKVKEFNQDVQYWNEKGGASEDEYDELMETKKELKEIADNLEKQRKEINNLAGKTDDLTSAEENIVAEYNASVNTYKNKYGGAREFEKGIFSGTEINIYQFKEKTDLKLTLTHELGHYLGLGHTQDSKSIMYYLIGDQDMNNLTLMPDDLSELRKVCKIK